MKSIVFSRDFGWRIGCRIRVQGVGFPTPNARSSVSFRVFVPEGVACFCAKCGEKSKKIGCNGINPTPCTRILHPILHPKMSVNTGILVLWCRKCRRFTKTFFVEGGERCGGPESAKHRTSLTESTEVLHWKYGGLPQRSPMFCTFRKGGRPWQCHVPGFVSSVKGCSIN